MTQFADHINEIQELFSEHLDLTEEDVRSEFKQLVLEFDVPLDEARRSIINSYADEADISTAALFDDKTITDIRDVNEDGEWLSVEITVVELWEPRSESIAQVGLIADETGRTKFTKWATSNLPELEEGKSYRLEDVVTDEYEGNYSVTLNSSTTITELDDDIEAGDGTVEYDGTIVAVQNGSGLIKRCPEEDCTRVVNNGRCSEHGEVDGEFDMRLKAVLDNGDTVHNVLFGKEATEALTGVSLEDAKNIAKDALDSDAPLKEMKPAFLGRYYTITGREVGEYILVTGFEQVTAARPAEQTLIRARSM